MTQWTVVGECQNCGSQHYWHQEKEPMSGGTWIGLCDKCKSNTSHFVRNKYPREKEYQQPFCNRFGQS